MKCEKTIPLVFVLLLAAGLLCHLLWPDRAFSENENRALQEWPAFHTESLFSGSYTAELEQYASDQFPARDLWIGLKTGWELTLQKRDNGRVLFGKDGQLFEYLPPSSLSEERIQGNSEAIARFLGVIGEQYPAVQSSVLLAPTASEVLAGRLPAAAPVPDQADIIRRLRDALPSTVRFCDPTAVLAAHTDEAIYFRTDHHWTADGAYYAYTAWAESAGWTPLSPERFTRITVSDHFLGTLYSKANWPLQAADSLVAYRRPEDAACRRTTDGGKIWSASLYAEEALDTKDQYTYFLGGNQPLTEIQTGVRNGRTLLLIKDSYAHAMAPFLACHYETILAVDLRYYRSNLLSLMESHNVTDLLFLYNAVTFAHDTSLAPMLSLY